MQGEAFGEGESAVSSAEPTGPAGETAATGARPPRSALADIAERTVLGAGRAAAPAADLPPPTGAGTFTAATATEPDEADRLRAHRRAFLSWLGGFRRRRVLVPYGANGAALTVEAHGARWLLAFTDEAALARYARARGERDRSWSYRLVWGAAVLDAGVPAVAATGMPCGVLVDAGDGERGTVLPPVVGIVPEPVAVNRTAGDAKTDTGPDRDTDTGTGTGRETETDTGPGRDSGRRTGEERS